MSTRHSAPYQEPHSSHSQRITGVAQKVAPSAPGTSAFMSDMHGTIIRATRHRCGLSEGSEIRKVFFCFKFKGLVAKNNETIRFFYIVYTGDQKINPKLVYLLTIIPESNICMFGVK